ncbi:Y+L amino acid transporter 1 [Orchesella cincta]|uniref:Y+L amino acid transporter 1 n=1 Tax=Orchesella cincta TaxID=48709 RepID=A0A1D2NDZ4_ORCCI|nr:Y+L amino acid transporter 1 [Orchesella cincta]
MDKSKRRSSNTSGNDTETIVQKECLLSVSKTCAINKDLFAACNSTSEVSSIAPTISSTTFSGSINSSSKNSLEIKNGTNGPKTKKKVHEFDLFAVVLLVFCAISGSGVLATPQFVYSYTGNAAVSLLIWSGYGIMALLGALCYIELGITFPVGGGEYMYLNEAFGALPAFLYQWGSFIFVPAVNSELGLVASQYLVAPHVDDIHCPSSQRATRLLAVSFILILSYINCVDPKITERFNKGLTICKLGIMGSMIFCGVNFAVNQGLLTNENFAIRPQPDPQVIELREYDVAKIVRAVYQVGYTYHGLSHLYLLVENVENPQRCLPRGVAIAVPLVIIMYLSVNFMYFVTLDKATILSTQAIANEMFKKVFPSENWIILSWVLPTIIAISVVGTISVRILMCSRINLVGARNKQCPKFLSLVDRKHSTPILSIILQALLAILWALFGSVRLNIGLSIYTEGGFTLAVMYGLIYMRITRPLIPRPLKIPLFVPIVYALVLTSLHVSPFFTLDAAALYERFTLMGGAVAVILTGVPVYFILVRRKTNYGWLSRLNNDSTVFLQKTFNLVTEEQFHQD